MQVDIITPDEKLFSGESTYIEAPGSDGQLGILNNHAPLISALKKGELTLRTAEGNKTFTISSGVIEVLNNQVTILAEK